MLIKSPQQNIKYLSPNKHLRLRPVPLGFSSSAVFCLTLVEFKNLMVHALCTFQSLKKHNGGCINRKPAFFCINTPSFLRLVVFVGGPITYENINLLDCSACYCIRRRPFVPWPNTIKKIYMWDLYVIARRSDIRRRILNHKY